MGFVYILKCRNKRFYIGSTKSVERRFAEHNRGHVKATRHLRPLELIFHQKLESLKEARKMEYWLKRQKDSKLIEQIIADGRIKKLNQ